MGFFKKLLGAAIGGVTGFATGGAAGAFLGAASGLQSGIGADRQDRAAKQSKREMQAQSEMTRNERTKATNELNKMRMQTEAKKQQISAKTNQRRRVRGSLLGNAGGSKENEYSMSMGG